MSSFKFEAWPTEFRKLTQYFGVNPQNYSQFGLPGHEGLDIRAPKGSNIYAVAPGRVKLVVRDPSEHNYGIHVRITHIDGYETIYAHLEKALIKEGNRVQAGTVIGLADDTGNSFGSHLHLTLKRKGTTVGNWPGNIIDPTPFILPLLAWKKPAGPYHDGWVCTAAISILGDLAQVNAGDAHLRVGSNIDSEVIEMIPAGTMLVVTGDEIGECVPVQVPSRALDNAPAMDAPAEPDPKNLVPPEGVLLGWVFVEYLEVTGHFGMVGRHGANVRSAPKMDAEKIGQVQWGYMLTLVGLTINGYAPVFIFHKDIVAWRDSKKPVQKPKPFPASEQEPEEETITGWVLTVQIDVSGTTAVVGRLGVNLRENPRRNGLNLGFIPLGTSMKVTGPPAGEYTPVQVSEHEVQQPAAEQIPPLPDPEPKPLGQVRIGLHASADPDISDEEVGEFGLFRPSIIKVLSFHNPVGLRKLAQNHPDAKWIVRAFLDFGGRSISPQRFFNDTISDMKRTMDILQGRDVVIELHNEPNLLPEGLESSWADGADFATWWLRLLRLYRYIFPDQRFIYPGLSPGAEIYRFKQDHIRFLEASRPAIKAADGLGIHLYWSVYTPMSEALKVLDDTISRYRNKPIWVTESSNNKGGITAPDKAREYLVFWKKLQERPIVKGVTYFVASSINPQFSEEVFVGRGMSRIIGAR